MVCFYLLSSFIFCWQLCFRLVLSEAEIQEKTVVYHHSLVYINRALPQVKSILCY